MVAWGLCVSATSRLTDTPMARTCPSKSSSVLSFPDVKVTRKLFFGSFWKETLSFSKVWFASSSPSKSRIALSRAYWLPWEGFDDRGTDDVGGVKAKDGVVKLPVFEVALQLHQHGVQNHTDAKHP